MSQFTTLGDKTDTNLPIILFAVKSKLIDDSVYNETTCFVGQQPELNMVPPDISYAEITPGPQVLVNAETKTHEGTINIRIWFKMSLDIAMRANINLMQQVGIVQKCNKVMQSLDLVDLNILAQGMRFLDQTELIRDTTDWSYVDMIFGVLYGNDPSIINPIQNEFSEFTFEFNEGFN